MRWVAEGWSTSCAENGAKEHLADTYMQQAQSYTGKKQAEDTTRHDNTNPDGKPRTRNGDNKDNSIHHDLTKHTNNNNRITDTPTTICPTHQSNN
jgi:hypothetical protein